MSSSLQHPLKFAERMSHIGSVGSFDFAARARTIEAAGQDVVHFEIGEPDFPTPENIVDVAVKAMREEAYDRVFIDLDDISKCNNGDTLARMLYVAVSRARHQVFLTGDIC